MLIQSVAPVILKRKPFANTLPQAKHAAHQFARPNANTMAQTVKDSFLDLERHRQLLEENIEKLRKSLRHWQTWLAECEGLKEEILAVKPLPNRQQLVSICREYEGELVTKKEVEELLGVSTLRSAEQIVNLLDRRIDYVEQNVQTVQRQLETSENKLAAATVISTPDVRNEDGLPLTEIIEELDEEGNVVSSRISTPGSTQPQLLEVLEKAGVKDVPTHKASLIESEPTPEEGKADPATTKPTKKGVKFAEDTKPGPELVKSQTTKRIEDIMELAKQQNATPSEPPIIPTDESPEDAALRREMLQYGMSEVGAVVAELDLEDGSDWTEDDYDGDETSSLDDEDEFGRSTGKVVDEELRREMIELEKRLGARMIENIGKKASDYGIVREGIGRITINGQEDTAAPKSILASPGEVIDEGAEPSAMKSVRFSEDLDISPAPKTSGRAGPAVKKTPGTAPVSDIVERTAVVQDATPNPPKKASRFKSARAATPAVVNGPLVLSATSQAGPALSLQPAKPPTPKPFSTPIQFAPANKNTRTAPTGPEGKILAPSIVERDVPLNISAVEPDELDPQLLNQEVATEYHKMRNRMIQRQGGFMKEEESEIVPFTEEEGGPKKMSRFKAARLARS